MISLLLLSSSFLNFIFYIYAIGFVVALVLEQIVRKSGNERNIYIVEYNRKYLLEKCLGCKLTMVCNEYRIIRGIKEYATSRSRSYIRL